MLGKGGENRIRSLPLPRAFSWFCPFVRSTFGCCVLPFPRIFVDDPCVSVAAGGRGIRKYANQHKLD